MATKVIAMTGDRDDNTKPEFARDYIEALCARQIDARFVLVPGTDHNSTFRPANTFTVIQGLLQMK